MNIKVTVFTPTFNRGNVLYRVFESLCAQTFKDFEWIIIDDGSNDNTKELVKRKKNITLFLKSHEYFDENVRDFEVGIFNLGYLPGGNHECVTQYETTLKTIKKALEHLVKGGCLYVVVYIGHDQGKESTNLDAYFRTLDHKLYNVAKFEMMNKNNSPYVVIIEKR